eukprot:6205802-Amphidinium_carterae.1
MHGSKVILMISNPQSRHARGRLNPPILHAHLPIHSPAVAQRLGVRLIYAGKGKLRKPPGSATHNHAVDSPL